MRITFFIIASLLFCLPKSEAQVVTDEKLKVVFQLTSSDTLVHKAMIKQLTNFLNAAPNSKLEVVCHNNGINFLNAETTLQANKIKELSEKGVDFVACNNTLTERKIPKEKLLPQSRIVPAGVVEIVQKQNKKWAYIKAG